MKIAVIGYSGAGKSTLAKRLGTLYRLPVLHLDRVQFRPGWGERDRAEAAAMVSAFMEKDGWVIDGNYHAFEQERRLYEADRILFFCFGRMTCLYQAFRRFWDNRGVVREDMADGCIEKLDWEFVRWILWNGRRKIYRERYRKICRQYPEKVTVFKNRKQVAAWLEQMQLEKMA